MHLIRSAAIAFLMIISGCSGGNNRPVVLSGVPREEWLAVAATLPLERRLDLYAQIYEVDQHPRDLTIVSAFRSNPNLTFDSIERRSKSYKAFFTYIWILIDIDESGLISLCGPIFRERMLIMAENSGVGTEDLENIGLTGCVRDL